MKINPSDLKTERKWRSATGLNKDRFYKLLFYFKQSYLATYGKDLNARQVENNLNDYCIRLVASRKNKEIKIPHPRTNTDYLVIKIKGM